MDKTKRQLSIIGLLGLTIVAYILAPNNKDETTIMPRENRMATIPTDRNSNDSFRLIPRDNLSKNDIGELFHNNAPFSVAAKKKVQITPPLIAPPLPFVYMGKLSDEKGLTVFITNQDKPYAVHTNDELDGIYRVDSINPAYIEFTYLPLNQKQILNIGTIK